MFDFWRREYLGIHAGAIRVAVAPHGVRLLSARDARREVEIVGTDVHVTQGGVELDDVEYAGDGISFALPFGREGAAYVRSAGQLRATGARARAAGTDVYRIEVKGNGAHRVRVSCR